MMPAPPKASVRPAVAFGKAVGARPAAAAPVHLGGRPMAPVPSPSMALVPASVGPPPLAPAAAAASNLNFAHLMLELSLQIVLTIFVTFLNI